MKNSVKLKGKQKLLFRYSLYLGFLLLGVNTAVYFISLQAGVLVSFFALMKIQRTLLNSLQKLNIIRV